MHFQTRLWPHRPCEPCSGFELEIVIGKERTNRSGLLTGAGGGGDGSKFRESAFTFCDLLLQNKSKDNEWPSRKITYAFLEACFLINAAI